MKTILCAPMAQVLMLFVGLRYLEGGDDDGPSYQEAELIEKLNEERTAVNE